MNDSYYVNLVADVQAAAGEEAGEKLYQKLIEEMEAGNLSDGDFMVKRGHGLDSIFVFGDTREGAKYWFDVHAKLREFREQKMLDARYYIDLLNDVYEACGPYASTRLCQILDDAGTLLGNSKGLWGIFNFSETEEGITYWCKIAFQVDKYRLIRRAKKAVKEALYE